MRGFARFWVLMVVVVFLLSPAGCGAPRSMATQPPAEIRFATEPPTAAAVMPVPTDTAEIPTRLPSSTPTAPLALPTATSEEEPTPTSVPPSEQPSSEPSTEVPTATFTAESPTETPVRATDARVIYHNGFSQDGIGVYERGGFPWLDLLVRLGETWYGPEREPDDGFQAVPLPEAFRWEVEGGFGTLPNGEAWWAESGTTGVARLLDTGGEVLVELPLQIIFRDSGRGDGNEEPGLSPTPT